MYIFVSTQNPILEIASVLPLNVMSLIDFYSMPQFSKGSF